MSNQRYVHQTGVRLATIHQSVNRGIPLKKVYKTVAEGVVNPPFRPEPEVHVSRMKAVQYAFSRVRALGERYTENYRVSRKDRAGMENEFNYLSERIQSLISDRHYRANLNVRDGTEMIPPEHMDTIRLRLKQLTRAVFHQTYKQAEDTALNMLKTLYQRRVGRYDGDVLKDMNLAFRGPMNFFLKDTPLVRTVMDIKGEIDALPSPEDEHLEEEIEPEEWFEDAAKITALRIIHNPNAALATQIEGHHKHGKIHLEV